MGFRATLALIAALIAGPALAGDASWDGRWSGRLSTGASVIVTIAGGEVRDYRFGGQPAKVAYGKVTAENVSFSPGSAAVITMTPAGPDQANYTFFHPMTQGATGVLSRVAARPSAAGPVKPTAARVPDAWVGTWGRPDATLIRITKGGIAYSHKGEGYTIAGIRVDETSLSFDVLPAARVSLTMRPDLKADFVFTRGATVFRSQIWRGRTN